MTFIPRRISSSILRVPKNKAVELFGMRQVGKTTLLEHLFKNYRTAWYTGDSPDDVRILTSLPSANELRTLIANYEFIVIDEAQRIPSIGLLIKRFVDLKTDCQLIVTGSSSLDLAGGTFESAAGRFRAYQLWPFSAQELADSSSWIDEIRSLSDRLVYGSFPFVIDDPEQAKEDLVSYAISTAFKDIYSLSGIRDHRAFDNLVYLRAHNIGNLITVSSLGRECGLSSTAIENYLTLLEQSFIIKILPSYAKNLANELKKSKKIYFCDLGLRNAILRRFTPFGARPPEEQGALFENYFVMERIKKCSYDSRFTQHYFWRTKNANEIDLIEVTDDNIEAFEIKLSQPKAKVPPSFREAYPDALFHTVNRDNFYKYLESPSG